MAKAIEIRRADGKVVRAEQLIPGQTYHVIFDDAGNPYLDARNRQTRRQQQSRRSRKTL